MKKTIILLSLIFLLTGCSTESETYVFEGRVVDSNASRFDRGIIVQAEDGKRIRITEMHYGTDRSDFDTVIVGDHVYVEYKIEPSEEKFAYKFEIQ